MHTIESQ